MKRLWDGVRIAGGSLLVLAYVVGFLSPLTPVAWAGERYLGSLLASDGGTVCNATTGYDSQTFARAFRVPTSALLSVQCNHSCSIGVNVRGVDAGNGVHVVADQFFTTSTPSGAFTHSGLPDGGSYSGGAVCVAPTSVAAEVCMCRVWDRNGEE